MVRGADDYTIHTKQSAIDVVLNIFTSLVTVYSRTVTVELPPAGSADVNDGESPVSEVSSVEARSVEKESKR
jgi:hypothetical protein